MREQPTGRARGAIAVVIAMTLSTTVVGAVASGTAPPSDPSTTARSAASSDPPGVTAATPPTSIAPTTVADPAAALEAAITDAATQATAAGRNALFHQPDDPAATTALDHWFVAGGPARARIDRLGQELSAAGRARRAHPDIADGTTVEDVVPGAAPLLGRAGVVVCAVEASQVTNLAGSDVLGQDVTSYRQVYEMNLVDGAWKLLTVSTLQTWSGQAECAPPTDESRQAAEIAIRISEIEATRVGAVVDIDGADPAVALSSVLTEGGPAMEGTRGFIQALRDNGERVRTETGRPVAMTVERLDLLDGPPATKVDALVCGLDPTVIYEPGGGLDGQDAIVNDLIAVDRLVLHLVLEDGTWQLDGAEGIDQWTGVRECPPE